tara:strand:+ start:6406 stop:6957 length:552 start_codon:yes stop_codon:yes gene_type:complete
MNDYNNFDLRSFIAEGKKESIKEAGPGFDHDCAAHVVHETYGYGICLDGQHTLVETVEGKHVVTHYDVFFKEGNKTVKNVPVEDLDVLNESSHKHSKKKNESDVAKEGETVEEAKDGDMPSKAHVEKMCKDGKSKKEISKMHPDCDQEKLGKMVDDCKEQMAEETKLTKEGIFKKKIKGILDS